MPWTTTLAQDGTPGAEAAVEAVAEPTEIVVVTEPAATQTAEEQSAEAPAVEVEAPASKEPSVEPPPDGNTTADESTAEVTSPEPPETDTEEPAETPNEATPPAFVEEPVTEPPSDVEPPAGEDAAPTKSAQQDASSGGTLPVESSNGAATPDAAGESDVVAETGQSAEEAMANAETVGDLVEAAPDDNVEIVSIESVDLAPAVEAEVNALVARDQNVTVQAALVPVHDAPENVVAILVGEGITYSNIGYVGGTGIVGFEEGVILGTGDITGVTGPNVSDGLTTQNNTPGDEDLDGLVGAQTHDAAVLTFDFVPEGNKVEFSYVFSSEEHNEYGTSRSVNDAERSFAALRMFRRGSAQSCGMGCSD